MVGWQEDDIWGRQVKLCMALGGTDFCLFCLLWARIWNKWVLGRESTTFVGDLNGKKTRRNDR